MDRTQGFTAVGNRPRRLRLLLESYGWSGSLEDVLDAVQDRVAAHAQGLRKLAEEGDPLFSRLVSSSKQPKLNVRQEAHLVSLFEAGEHSSAELADLFGVGRSTVYRAVERNHVART